MKQIGEVQSLARYPVKSMAGIEMERATLGWHGLVGDRRLGVRQVDNRSGFPWLSASRLPDLLLYTPCDFNEASDELLPQRVRTAAGELLEVNGHRLSEEIGERVGGDVELLALKHGIFDDAPVSVIASSTISQVCEQAKIASDRRRFRANIVVDLAELSAFAEDDWTGRVVVFGQHRPAPAIYVTKRDVRCKMIGLDPETAEYDPSVLKAAVDLNENNAGVYGTVVATGTINVGDPVLLVDHPAG